MAGFKSLVTVFSKSKQFWALVGLLLLCAQVNEAQFFTKSSKSIPRMGRRSDSSIQKFNHKPLVDMLLDEYGPDLTASILGKHSAYEDNQVPPLAGEIAYRNEQPIDWNNRLIDYGNIGLGMSRDERSSQDIKSIKQGSNHDASLAMRALNTNRLLQYLASGQPLTSYDRLLATQKYQDSTKGGESQRRIVANDRK